jgi:hypothetical protein
MRKCVKCNSVQNVQEHHIIPKWMGGKDCIGDPSLGVSNRVLLCEYCHDELQKFIHRIIVDYSMRWINGS